MWYKIKEKLGNKKASIGFMLILIFIGIGIARQLKYILQHLFVWLGWLSPFAWMENELFANIGTFAFPISDLLSEIGGEHLIPIYQGTYMLVFLVGLFCVTSLLRKIFVDIEQRNEFFTIENKKRFEKMSHLTLHFGLGYIVVQILFGLIIWGQTLDIMMDRYAQAIMLIDYFQWFILFLIIVVLNGFVKIFKHGMKIKEENDAIV